MARFCPHPPLTLPPQRCRVVLFLGQAWRRLAAWRPVVAAETLMVVTSLAFTAVYNHAFWHLLFS